MLFPDVWGSGQRGVICCSSSAEGHNEGIRGSAGIINFVIAVYISCVIALDEVLIISEGDRDKRGTMDLVKGGSGGGETAGTNEEGEITEVECVYMPPWKYFTGKINKNK